MKIEAAKDADIATCMELNATAMPEHYKRDFWEGAMRDSNLFVARMTEAGDDVVGYAMGMDAAHETTLTKFIEKFKQKTLLIVSVAVRPDFGKHGIGTDLMRKIWKEAKEKGYQASILEVRASNWPAVSFYHKLGMRNVGVLDAYYSDGESALIFFGVL
jgi:ribosomal-protein-alanine N-acetyltransferase